ncbi:zinc finger protein 41 isoform X1 [Amyelois transitella]|uniref:zinc finger protein 41 isoform X1 n=1 Tax=Amyelois transitella TaxID=680683 RepID=UPI00298FD47B|nr:zinc finger protein 41 isoform X1 [Amyelois transitella]XP_060807591.1 zinc finger protein 41 isoform X1 [Amyelois transitella]XP_060807592.1 zinc finger protein 41 isoform X1 [Amyelois transitella]XP_060807593.1 zinc finger protein 41 isoform X1 [Amyelois transitella]XP_060807594.1 zinc finger protein 41 isoform X1 [Amyelois transitella]XP_060807595.1 zinc finger protein 41 isoform X1 [Amyelois transitella]XP_060807596.1 zinc finger protein 41 isoform X1 [Amyelois transitella]XP_06080759
MDDTCRLCCSTKYVNNNIFDEETALYLKMALYLPIKVFKNDRLPQKICDKCSCKVNDIYQFCNETIEVQKRLQSMLSVDYEVKESVDITLATSVSGVRNCDQGTQTDSEPSSLSVSVKVKQEPFPDSPEPVKQELAVESDNNKDFSTLNDNVNDDFNDHADIPSDNSDNISLLNLKKKKKSKREVNGQVEKRGRKKKPKLNDWNVLISELPEGAEFGVENNKVSGKDIEVKREHLEDLLEPPEVKKEPEDVFQCCICFLQLCSRSDMLQHYKQHAVSADASAAPPPAPPAQGPLRCVRCGKVLQSGEWAAHWARHWERDRRPLRCALCEKTFRDAHQILKHGLTHKVGEEGAEPAPLSKRFICDLCPEGFVYMRHLLSHRLRSHPEAAARALALRCAECGRTFAHLNSLRRHLRAHSGERNFLCNVCGKALSSREHLKFHIRIHTGYKPNVCKTCGKGFVKKCNLTLHERVHSGEKPHVCSHCGKAFSQRSTLVIHERYHSGARPYVCALCGRGFVAKGLLSMHLKSTCI